MLSPNGIAPLEDLATKPKGAIKRAAAGRIQPAERLAPHAELRHPYVNY